MSIKFKRLQIVLVGLTLSLVLVLTANPADAHTWPGSGDWKTLWSYDVNRCGSRYQPRDVGAAYYHIDGTHLYLRLYCYAPPAFKWYANRRYQEGRYKWYIDLNGNASFYSMWFYVGVRNAEYLLFVEDTDDDNSGDVYLLNDADGNGNFSEWEPDYLSGNVNVTGADAGYRITGNYIDVYVALSNIGDPADLRVAYSTDSEAFDLDGAPPCDRPDNNKFSGLLVRDSDGDGEPDDTDNCPAISNPD
jgi:hypothetical protein